MADQTENFRRKLVSEINEEVLSNRPDDERKRLEEKHGRVWDTKELQEDFEVISFAAPFVMVRRKLDGQMGGLAFQHLPRFYFRFISV